jgi:uncharacterized protein (DUF433 family)
VVNLNVELPDFLGPYHDEVRLKGHRIGLYDIVVRYREGFSVEMLAAWFPTLPLSMIHKVLGFYLEHKAAVDEYVEHYGRELDEQETGHPTRVTTQMLRERLGRMQDARQPVRQ